ncbi:MAG: dTDP-glucose 4,6-dehydratase [Nitrospirae bacterium]|nr:MAG: dTDP-glucose 4,6-dehydratase [Nitrospirota bacterium]
MSTLVVTGGAGFIGTNFVRLLLDQADVNLVIVDKLTYAGHLINLDDVLDDPRVTFVQADIADRAAMDAIFHAHRPQAVINFAAESHVDRSIDHPGPFIDTNIVGTFVLLECARQYLRAAPRSLLDEFRFLHVSTDEVYGTLGPTGKFSEDTPYAPNTPYAASKAAADHLVRAYYHTYRLPTIITNCSNNYGPYQFPEKLIPLVLLNAIEGKPLPVYGTGHHVRDWLFVRDHCEGIWCVLQKGVPGEKYNLGGNQERTNLQTVQAICRTLDRHLPATQNTALARQGLSQYDQLITFVDDRPGHDLRYAIDATKIARELGWRPRHDFESGLDVTVQWYVEHREWCARVQSDNYGRERLGLMHKQG